MSEHVGRVLRELGALSASLCLILAGCGSAPDAEPTASDATASEIPGERRGQIPTSQPTRANSEKGSSTFGRDGEDDVGEPGGGGAADEGDATGAGSRPPAEGGDDETDARSDTDGADADDAPRGVEVAGPTLGNDYPEYFGNIYAADREKCANFVNDHQYDVTILAVSASSPLVLVTDCMPGSGESPTVGCTADLVLPGFGEATCTLGVRFAQGTDFAANYLPMIDWRLSVVCTDAVAEPCSAPDVVAHGPSEAEPVVATWTMVDPVRFCGATDYADEHGGPGGVGGAPRNGCTTEPPDVATTSPDE